MRSIVRTCVALAAIVGLGGCTTTGESPAVRSIATGPAADYPVVVGDAFFVEGVEYQPADRLNYDAVGILAGDDGAGPGVTIAHKTLPLPSYVEITALDTGRTILARVERRGPMRNDRIAALSSDAAAQLQAGEGTPVRIRRVVPPEAHRAELRADRVAPLRMDTPEGLLRVLRLKLPDDGTALLTDPRQEAISGQSPGPGNLAAIDPDSELGVAKPGGEMASPVEPDSVEEPPAAEMAQAALDVTVPSQGDYVIQLGAFSVEANANRLAEKVGGAVNRSGRLSLVTTGPYSTRGQAEAALAKLKSEGYKDAIIRSKN